MGRACKYYTYREGADQAQRQWRNVDGEVLSYDRAREEIREQSKTWGYSYRIVLSTEAARIGPEGYQQVLAGRFEHAYFIEHLNTDHPHAHVITFTKKILSRAELKGMREQLRELEQAKERELAQAGPIRQAQPTREAAPARQAEPTRRRQRDQDLERD